MANSDRARPKRLDWVTRVVRPLKPLGGYERVVLLAAILYVLALLAIAVVLPLFGEHWWVTGVALYAPRFFLGVPLPFLTLAMLGRRLRPFLWTQALALFLLVFPIMGFVIPRPHWHRESPVVRVLTYNIDSSETISRIDDVLAEIEGFSPDVVFLEEAMVGEERFLPKLQERFATVQATGQFVVAAKFPLVKVETPPQVVSDGRPHSPRFLRVVLDTSLGPITFYVVHPISPRESLLKVRAAGKRGLLFGRVFDSATAAAFYANAHLREVQVQTFGAEAQHEPGPVVVAGDTNLPDLSLVLGENLSSLEDGFTEAGWGLGYTFPTNKRFPQWMRIDRILAGHGLHFVGFHVGTAPVSDHLCVVADLVREGT
jgi:endonuclease/exonuclease/phosphatase family metal-dependent hydrolase